ncbi:MAG TPA: hypothetical protein VGX21_18430 [Methylomirabilota bacterium]|jgi:hypothetical protein|nr:hypothetical protein [Methylomirabilota bacterium]
MTIVQIEANLAWRGSRTRGGRWVAVCEPLGLTVQSDTWGHLMEDIAETMNAMFTDLLKSGDLERFLRDRGWRTTGPIPVRKRDIWFDVPFRAETTDRDPALALR